MANLKIKDENGNWVGIASLKGETGPQGPAGAPGANGKDGVTPTFEVGTVSTGEPNVEMTGENNHYTLDFTFPESSGGNSEVTVLDKGSSQRDCIVLKDLNPGIYRLPHNNGGTHYFKITGEEGYYDYLTMNTLDYLYIVHKKYEDAVDNEIVASYMDARGTLNLVQKSTTSNTGIVRSTSQNSELRFVQKDTSATITSKWTFSKLPESSQTPTTDNQFTTKAYVDNLINVIYPVGTYYETSDTSFNPNTSFGGTWVLEEDGTVLVSKSNVTDSKFNTDVGTVLGEEAVQLDLPNYQYNVWNAHTTNPGNDVSRLWSPDGDALGLGLVYESNKNVPHNNIQPSKIVNRWHRTA